MPRSYSSDQGWNHIQIFCSMDAMKLLIRSKLEAHSDFLLNGRPWNCSWDQSWQHIQSFSSSRKFHPSHTCIPLFEMCFETQLSCIMLKWFSSLVLCVRARTNTHTHTHTRERAHTRTHTHFSSLFFSTALMIFQSNMVLHYLAKQEWR